MKLKQFEIWYADLEPHFGSEQGGARPVLVVETNAVHPDAATTIIIPFTSQMGKHYSFDIVVNPSKSNGLSSVSKLLFRQLRIIDKRRLKEKRGILEKTYHDSFKTRLGLLFDMSGDYRD